MSLVRSIGSNNKHLVIECVSWTALQADGDMYAYTAKTIAQLANAGGYTWLGKHWKSRLPKSGYLEYDQSGVPKPSSVPSGTIPYETIIIEGYGLITISPDGEVSDDESDAPTPPAEGVTDYLKANELNYYFPDMIK